MTKICFCGISGNGMSPLAQIMSLKGCEVYGSDRNFDAGRDGKNRQALLNMNIKLVSQDGSGITADTETVYVSAALDENNPDIKAARALNIPVKQRSDLLAEVFHGYPFGIAVGGICSQYLSPSPVHRGHPRKNHYHRHDRLYF